MVLCGRSVCLHRSGHPDFLLRRTYGKRKPVPGADQAVSGRIPAHAETLEEIRKDKNIPVIMLSAKSEDIDKINSDITDLFSLEQEVKIHVIPMEWVENMELTAKQVAAFSFMIEEETEEE